MIKDKVLQQPPDGWSITTGKTDAYTGVVLANGRIGILPTDRPFETQSIILNNVYEKEKEDGVSRIVLGLNFAQLDLWIDGEEITEEMVSDFTQTLDMKAACLVTSFDVLDKARISYTIYALRNSPYAGYIDIRVEARKELHIKAMGRIDTPTGYQSSKPAYEVLQDLETTMPILRSVARTEFGRHDVCSSATFVWHAINSTREDQRPELTHTVISDASHGLAFQQELEAGATFEFAWTGAVCSTQDFNDPVNESKRIVIFNLLNDRDGVIARHENLWADLWESDIIIEGNLQDQLDVRLGLYHLYSFSRADSDLSIAPMGLSSQNYNGHIFWDTELWMFPPLLVLHQDIARSLVNYRSDRLEKAKQKAINYGYQGAMFPWESDDTGEEATPAWALTGTFEHHITADIAISFWNYFRVTQDELWLRQRGYPLLKEVADFWVSRSVENTDGSYSILNVVGANEFAPNVNDNAFTNGSAMTALEFATKAALHLGEIPDPHWEQVANNLRLHRFDDGTTKEHADYTGDRIKQADVNLLAYPLDIVNDRETVEKDLDYYEPKLAEEGPAMGLSVFAVINARLGNSEEAYRQFKACFEPNKRPPFGAMAECATSNNPYFATGAGGMLQVVLFGFAGLHISDQGITQLRPVLPASWAALTITGVGREKKTYKISAKVLT